MLLTESAGPMFAGRPVRLRLTCPAEVQTESWWLLTGWQLGAHGEPLRLCCVPVRAAGIQLERRPTTPGEIF